MRRREFIALIGGAALAWPLAARAQQPEHMRRVVLLPTLMEDDPEGQKRVTEFVQGLRDLGWKEGDNIQIDYRWAGANVERARSIATEVVQQKPDAIVAESALTVTPLRELTSSIPIIFVQIADPVQSGFVASLARPGGNITGFTPFEFSLSGKLLEALKDVAPQISRVGIIYNPAQAPQAGMRRAIETAASSLGVQVIASGAGNVDEITRSIESFASGGGGGGGMIVLPNPINTASRGRIIELMAHHKIPAAYPYAFFVRDGGLLSYGVDPAAQFRQAASYVDRILKGTKPADLPVQQPTKFELAINLRTAKALGLTISRDFLQLADEVIE
jgi:putative ABC transport system substrate-binding protein